MVEADAAAVAALSAELGYPAGAADIAARMARVAGRADHAVWVHPDGEALLGFIHVQAMDRIISTPYAEILHLVVSDRARRRGVGRALVDQALAWTRERGFAHLRVRSNTLRDQSHAFYLALGFTRAKTQHVYTL